MFKCRKCGAGSSRMKLLSATSSKEEIRKITLRCIDCGSGQTERGGGLEFNGDVLIVANNTLKPYAKRHFFECPLILAVNSRRFMMGGSGGLL